MRTQLPKNARARSPPPKGKYCNVDQLPDHILRSLRLKKGQTEQRKIWKRENYKKKTLEQNFKWVLHLPRNGEDDLTEHDRDLRIFFCGDGDDSDDTDDADSVLDRPETNPRSTLDAANLDRTPTSLDADAVLDRPETNPRSSLDAVNLDRTPTSLDADAVLDRPEPNPRNTFFDYIINDVKPIQTVFSICKY
jgi:hypothetical protein